MYIIEWPAHSPMFLQAFLNALGCETISQSMEVVLVFALFLDPIFEAVAYI